MSEFLKFAFEFISKIVYNLVSWIVSIVYGFLNLFITGWADYAAIIKSYFVTMSMPAKILAILLIILVIAVPVAIAVLIIRKIIINIKLKANTDDNLTLYKEIGRLNKQVMNLMDEKNMILAMKSGVNGKAIPGEDGESIVSVGGTGGTVVSGIIPMEALKTGDGSGIPIANGAVGIPMAGGGAVAGGGMVAGGMGGGGMAAGGGSDMFDPLSEDIDSPAYAAAVAGGGVVGGSVRGDVTLGDDALSSAAAAAAMAAAQAKSKADEAERAAANRFPKLHNVDLKYELYDRPDFDNEVTLQQFTENYRLFAASQHGLYYTPEIVRRFVAGMAASQMLILEGISGTGKTSLPYSFSRYIDNPATIVSVQPSFRDRTELLGYFNEFSKRFNETEFLRALYEAGYREDPTIIVLDEMNLARVEYYFAEMLSVLEMPNKDEWVIDLVPTAWPGDPLRLSGGKLTVSPNTWFVCTANNDDSTFTITDKVYVRAIPIELNQRAEAFTCDLQPRCLISYEHLENMFEAAKEEHPISASTLAKMVKLDHHIQDKFRLAFGNRIVKQMYDFIPVYVACGGTELGGMDYIIAHKVLKKFESQNVTFVREDIKALISFIEKLFGANTMNDCVEYLTRIQNLY